jgi:hypothetical protein
MADLLSPYLHHHEDTPDDYVPCLAGFQQLLGDSTQSPKVFHLHHFDCFGYLPMAWRRLLGELSSKGYSLLVTTASGFDDDALAFLRSSSICVVRRPNRGLCIGAFRDTALLACAMHAAGVEWDHLILMNDSVLPVGELTNQLANLNSLVQFAPLDAPSLSGFTESYIFSHHLQSFGLCANRLLLRDPSWQLFWFLLDANVDKEALIRAGEVGLSSALRSTGVKLYPLYPIVSCLLLDPTSMDDLLQYRYTTFRGLNSSVNLWRTLLHQGFSFIKKEVLFDLSSRFGGPSCVHDLLLRAPTGFRDEFACDLTRLLVGRLAMVEASELN